MASSQGNSGILYVTMQPQDNLSLAQFHDWYNNEHGPTRLRLAFIQNGFRYKANDLGDQPGSSEKPEWMAIYDISDMNCLTSETYTRLRKAPVQSQRERNMMKEIHVDRRFYDLVQEWAGNEYKRLEEVEHEGESNVKLVVRATLKDGNEAEANFLKWYQEEHVVLLKKLEGWRRTRLFATSHLDITDGRPKEFFAQHDFAPENGLSGPEFAHLSSTEWTKKIAETVMTKLEARSYNLHYTFGPAPRDLKALTGADIDEIESTDGATRTIPSSSQDDMGVIESFVTTADGVTLPFCLTGSSDPQAPLLILINPILVAYGIWDDFVSVLLSKTNSRYRVLRYNVRGRCALPSSATRPVTIDLLSEDVITIMNALRAKTATLIGVSLGGATSLSVALRYPERVSAFVACDTNSFAPEGNPKAWDDRIAVAEEENATSQDSDGNIVGSRLASMTTDRWFTKNNLVRPGMHAKLAHVEDMVRTNSLAGFKDCVQALYRYDIREEMASFRGKAMFLVGAEDGVLPKTMAEMAKSLGTGVELQVVDGAGHLPMVEMPNVVANVVAEFLDG